MRFIRDKFSTAKSRNEVIGLDIGSTAIRYVVLKRSRSNFAYEVKSYGLEPISSDVNENRSITAHAQLAAHIRQLLTKTAITANYCVTALPDNLVKSQWVHIDDSARENFEIAIHLAVQEHIPYPCDAIYFAYQIFTAPQEEQNSLNVLLVACRKEHLDARLDILYQANLIPLCIEVNSHALERACAYLYPYSLTESWVMIDVGTTQLTFLFFHVTRRVVSYSEHLSIIDKELIFQQIQQCIALFCLRHPYYAFSELFFVGSNSELLQFLLVRFNSCALKSKIIACDKVLIYDKHIHETEFSALFPCLFLSFGLALRGLQPQGGSDAYYKTD
jgi:Tfp pilus assembly PilM family ATPase